MGWWDIEENGKQITQGDEPYDIMGEAFDQVVKCYQKNLGRKPTLDELSKTMEIVLASGSDIYLANGNQIEIVEFSIKTKKRGKIQRFQVGDFFIVPLENNLYAFGRILSDIRVEEMGMLVSIYKQTSNTILDIRTLKGTEFMFTPFYCSDEGWKSWKWKINGNIPIESDEFVYPKHKLGLEGLGWQIRDGDKIYEATSEEVEHLDYASIWSVETVEYRIKEYLKTKGVVSKM